MCCQFIGRTTRDRRWCLECHTWGLWCSKRDALKSRSHGRFAHSSYGPRRGRGRGFAAPILRITASLLKLEKDIVHFSAWWTSLSRSKMKDISKKKSKFRIRHSPGEVGLIPLWQLREVGWGFSWSWTISADSNQFKLSPAASPDTLHHTVWRIWLFIV